MGNRYKNRFAQMTIFDELIEQGIIDETAFFDNLNDIFDSRLKFPKRQKQKGMAYILGPLDSHVTDRKTHMDQTGNIISILATRLGLNAIIARYGMRGHDSGHPFGSHEGEEALNIIGILLNAGFFHHNAKGIDVVLSEDIIQKIVDATLKSIPDRTKREEIRNNPQIMKRIEEDSWYFLEFIVGHDGEATKKDLKDAAKSQKKFDSIKESVLYYTSRSNRTNNYKAQVSTLEAVLAKPADIIAYLKSDVENSFRKGVVYKLSDDYLECIGELLFEKEKIEPKNEYEKQQLRAQRIKNARDYLRKIEKSKLRESSKDVFHPANKRVLDVVDTIVKKLEEKGVYTYDKDERHQKWIDDLIADEIDKHIAQRHFEGEENMNVLYSERNKLDDFVHKMLKTRRAAIEEFTEQVKQGLIDDYCSNTLEAFKRIEEDDTIPEEEKKQKMMEAMNFSKRVEEIVYRPNGIKSLDYKEYVQYTKKEYQVNVLPRAAFEGIKMCAEALIKTGTIRDKFYDPTILDYIQDENVRNAMKTEFVDEREYDRYKESIGIHQFKTIRKPNKSKYKSEKNEKRRKNSKKRISREETKISGNDTEENRNELLRNIRAYTQRQGERFALTCEDVYYAIPNTIKWLLRKAIDPEYKPAQYLREEEQKRIFEIRDELRKRFGDYNGLAITAEDLKKYLEEKINYERTVNFAQNVANEIAIKYIGGYGNRGVAKLLINVGILSEEEYNEQDVPTREENESVKRLITKTDEDGRSEQSGSKEEKWIIILPKGNVEVKPDKEDTAPEKVMSKKEALRRNKKSPPLMVIGDTSVLEPEER